MDIATIFFILFVTWNFKIYTKAEKVYMLLQKIHNLYHNFWNSVNAPYFLPLNDDTNVGVTETDIVPSKPQIKYEDKYLEDIRKLDKEYKFTDDEENIRVKKYLDIVKSTNDSYREKIDEFEEKIGIIETKMLKYDGSDDDFCIYDDEDDDDAYLGETKEERVKNLLAEKKISNDELEKYKYLIETKDGQEKTMKMAEELSTKFIVDQRLEKLKNCFIIENTPLGNVLMIYDTERNTFRYYSDNNIPYRYLETAARKYVKQFACRPIYIDMEEELLLAEQKWDKEKKEKDEKDELEKKKREEEIDKNKKQQVEKRNVFTKFKSYNKDIGAGKVNYAAPPKNSIPNNKKLTDDQEKEKILLKDKANRYTYEGKFANFSFIKKVDRKVVDKKFGMSFADFKKMKKEKNE